MAWTLLCLSNLIVIQDLRRIQLHLGQALAKSFNGYLHVSKSDKYTGEYETTKKVTGRNATEYSTIFVHLSLLCIIRTIVAANATIIIDTERIKNVKPNIHQILRKKVLEVL